MIRRFGILNTMLLIASAWICGSASRAAVLNEIRLDAVGGLLGQQYVELMGSPGESLNNLSIVVIGPGVLTDQGRIKSVISLAGRSIPNGSSFFVVADSGFSLGVANLTATLNFPLGVAQTFLLVSNFTGSVNQDLDANNDGTLDVTPWGSIVDSLGFRDSLNLNRVYSTTTVSPGLLSLEVHAYRDPDGDPLVWKGGGSLVSTLLDTVGLANLNAAPTDITLSGLTVSEQAGIGAVIGNLASVDTGLMQTHAYSFVLPKLNAGGTFSLVGNQLRLNAALDYETSSALQVTIRSTDSGNGSLSFDKTFTITVLDENEAPGGNNLSTSNVDENAANGSHVATISAVDPDTSDTHAFSFAAPNNDAGGRFAIVGNDLQVSNGLLLDYEAQGSHMITIRVTDGGGLTFDQNFAITVDDLNEAPSDVTISAAGIAENAANGTAIGTVSAIDQDTASTHTFTLVAPNSDAGGRFTLVGNQLRVANGSLLNYEGATSHNITVRATDAGGAPFLRQDDRDPGHQRE